MHYLLHKELGDKIFDYLATKPFKEVEDMINGLRGLPSANLVPSALPDPEPAPEPTEAPIKEDTDPVSAPEPSDPPQA